MEQDLKIKEKLGLYKREIKALRKRLFEERQSNGEKISNLEIENSRLLRKVDELHLKNNKKQKLLDKQNFIVQGLISLDNVSE
jgi:hypothetical protein